MAGGALTGAAFGVGALADLLDLWPDVRFPGFFQAVYGLCLRQRLARVQPWHPRWRPLEPEWHHAPAPPIPESGLTRAVAQLTHDLSPAVLALLEGRADGVPLVHLAPQIGVSPRQAQRYWRTLLARRDD